MEYFLFFLFFSPLAPLTQQDILKEIFKDTANILRTHYGTDIAIKLLKENFYL